jgi:shikimate dehydrogenase
MKKYAVIGYPIGHSLSPQIHNFAFRKLNIDAEYSKIEIHPDKLDNEIHKLKSERINGFNVTIPHKLSIMKFLDEIDSDAEAIGAVNTVAHKDEKLIGYNTDVSGFLSPLQRYKNVITNCLVLGTGGAARAVLYALSEYINPDSITVAGRPEDNAPALTDEFGPLFKYILFYHHSLTKLSDDLSEYNLIVNATPLGMFPHIEHTALPQLAKLNNKTIVYDLVYNPQKTKFLTDAQKSGKDIILIYGIEMFIQQAASAFKLWTDRDMPVDDVRGFISTILNQS